MEVTRDKRGNITSISFIPEEEPELFESEVRGVIEQDDPDIWAKRMHFIRHAIRTDVEKN